MLSCTTETLRKKEASLKQTIIYVDLDVDNTQYQGSALRKRSVKSFISNFDRL